MKISWASTSVLKGLFLGALLVLAFEGRPAFAAPCVGGPSVCGQNSGLVPFHKDAILASLIWAKEKTECPKMIIWMRPSEFKPKDYLNPTVGGVFSGFNQNYIDSRPGRLWAWPTGPKRLVPLRPRPRPGECSNYRRLRPPGPDRQGRLHQDEHRRAHRWRHGPEQPILQGRRVLQGAQLQPLLHGTSGRGRRPHHRVRVPRQGRQQRREEGQHL